jgi:hypothetical protein
LNCCTHSSKPKYLSTVTEIAISAEILDFVSSFFIFF